MQIDRIDNLASASLGTGSFRVDITTHFYYVLQSSYMPEPARSMPGFFGSVGDNLVVAYEVPQSWREPQMVFWVEYQRLIREKKTAEYMVIAMAREILRLGASRVERTKYALHRLKQLDWLEQHRPVAGYNDAGFGDDLERARIYLHACL